MNKKISVTFLLIFFFVASIYAQCTANFSYSITGLFDYGFVNLSSPFGDTSITYQWNFGDGGTSTLENPSHTFDSLGTYIVCMTMHDPTFNCSATYCDTIVIACPAVAGYTYNKVTNYAFDFDYASSANDQVTWFWNFGDGDTADTRTVTHTFAHTGIYDVCLTVTDVNTGCTNTYCSNVIVCVAQADFTHSSSSLLNYSFTDISFGEDASTTYLWNFGDGDSSTVQDPAYTFPGPGTYDVCLTIDVRDSGCSNQYCTLISVDCQDSANFNYTNTGGLTFQFTDISTGEDTSVTYSWSFGDGTASPEKNPVHTFTSTGTHDVCLTIRNVDQGCTSTYCTTVVITCNDSAGFTYTNNGYTYHFSDMSAGEDTSAAFDWNFGDGDSSTTKNPIHTYFSSGAYQVCLKMTDVDVSCSSEYCQTINVISGINWAGGLNNYIRVYPNPATDKVYIDLNGFEARSIVIFNQLGQKVKQVVPNGNGLIDMDITVFPAGIYSISAMSDHELLNSTLIVGDK